MSFFNLQEQNKLKSFKFQHTKGDIISIDFHLHNGYEVYFLISGDVNYFIEKKVYSLNYGDIIITNKNEVHKPSFLSNKQYERICLEFGPELPQVFSSPGFDLLKCFDNRPNGEFNRISLNKTKLEEFLKLMSRLEAANSSKLPGSEQLLLTAFIDTLIFLNREFMDIKPEEEHANVPERLIPILDYIDENPEADLSLEALEKRFYINRYYLSHVFKDTTGMNIHRYITLKRIAKAKNLLESGHSVTEAGLMTGFNDYANFIRTFKKAVGKSPGKYMRNP